MGSTNTDRIEKQVVLRAPRARVWRALTRAQEFGEWFRVKLEGDFVAGHAIRGSGFLYPGYEHLTVELFVERLEPEQLFAYRWHPYAVDGADYSKEPTTLVEFRLDPAEGGTRLTIVESGFDRIPLARRAEAFRMNDRGWGEQAENIGRHVSST